MGIGSKILWMVGALVTVLLFLVGVTSIVFSEFGGGSSTAMFALPASILLGGVIAGSFKHFFPDRWP
ncbi:MAG: hypothetical protein ACRDJI_11145 [Actinomycetota bacterium]